MCAYSYLCYASCGNGIEIDSILACWFSRWLKSWILINIWCPFFYSSFWILYLFCVTIWFCGFDLEFQLFSDFILDFYWIGILCYITAIDKCVRPTLHNHLFKMGFTNTGSVLFYSEYYLIWLTTMLVRSH